MRSIIVAGLSLREPTVLIVYNLPFYIPNRVIRAVSFFHAISVFAVSRKPPCGRMYSISAYLLVEIYLLSFHYKRLRFSWQHRTGTFVSVLQSEIGNTSSTISINESLRYKSTLVSYTSRHQ